MKFDKKLKFADKYNWWTKDSDKKEIKLETKIGYIMQNGSSDELFYVIKNFDIDVLKSSYNIIKNDSYKLKSKRKSAIESIFELKSASN